MTANKKLTMRPATLNDVSLLYYWDEKPHVKAATSNDGTKSFDAEWEEELKARTDGTEFMIAEVQSANGKRIPIGAVCIIDPATERSHYWGDCEPNLRALDIWIGEETYLGKGYGTQMMTFVINRCFANPTVKAILIDPLSNNTGSHQFYQKLGFRFVERRQFDEDSDCFVFRLTRERWSQTVAGNSGQDH